jgi:uncharacterized protein (DUF2141 family)
MTFFILCFLTFLSPSPSVQIQVRGLEPNGGLLMVGFQDEKMFLSERYITTTSIPLKRGQVQHSLVINGLPQDKQLALLIYQDLNGNGKLDKNTLGAPVEPFGFSNNVKVRFSAPYFKDVAFKTSNQAQNLAVTLNRWSL